MATPGNGLTHGKAAKKSKVGEYIKEHYIHSISIVLLFNLSLHYSYVYSIICCSDVTRQSCDINNTTCLPMTSYRRNDCARMNNTQKSCGRTELQAIQMSEKDERHAVISYIVSSYCGTCISYCVVVYRSIYHNIAGIYE